MAARPPLSPVGRETVAALLTACALLVVTGALVVDAFARVTGEWPVEKESAALANPSSAQK